MQFKQFIITSVVPALLFAPLSTGMAGENEKAIWSAGHGDLFIDYKNKEWGWRIGTGVAPENLSVSLGASAKLEIPDVDTFNFLGEPGDPIWVIPQTAADDVVYMGLNSSSIPSGTFQNNRLNVILSSVTGPGDFIMWTTTTPTQVEVRMNSRDGITDADQDRDRPAPGHWHQNWGFTAPGTYLLGLKASAIPSGADAPQVSDEQLFQFEVSVFKEGEIDLSIHFDDGELELALAQEEGNAHVEFAANEAALHAGPESLQLIPNQPGFAFLGKAGEPIYVLPQQEREGVLFLGVSGDEVPTGVFLNDRVDLKLVSVSGPGDLFLYRVGALGGVEVFFNTRDGLSDADRFPVKAGSHSHQNWAFSKPGYYRVGLQALGTFASNNQNIASEVVEFYFEVFAARSDEADQLELGIARKGADTVVLSWPSETGVTYRVQSRADLNQGAWADLGAPISGTGQPVEVEVPIGASASQFFRVRQEAP